MNRHAIALLATLSSAPFAHALDLVPLGSTWEYIHPLDGTNPTDADPDFDTTWFLNGAQFDATYDGPEFGADPAIMGPTLDSGSGAAPLGYGAVTYIEGTLGGILTQLTPPTSGLRNTAYFRHEFTLAADVTNLALEIIADDAAVVYLNGVELLRTNFFGPDTYAAQSNLPGVETTPQDFLGRLGELEAGTYTLAVSLHQYTNDSSDLGFDLRLSDEGFADAPAGVVQTAAAPDPVLFFMIGELNGWTSVADSMLALNGLDGGEIRSEVIDLSAVGDAVFSMDIFAQELSGGSNFEVTDSFAARLEIEESGGGTFSIPLVPGGWDFDGNGALNGEDFGPGVAVNFAVTLSLVTAKRIPADAVSATLVVNSVNDSGSETFRFGDARLAESALTPPLLGVVNFGAPMDVFVIHTGGWDSLPSNEFFITGIGATATLISDPIDVTAAPGFIVSFTLNTAEASAGSNFEPGDAFQAWVEVVDANGIGRIVPMAFGSADLDANDLLTGDEIAPGAAVSLAVNESFTFSAELPAGAVSATLVARGFNDSASETFTISEFKIEPAAPSFAIISVTEAGGEVEVTWESEIDAIYELQFSADLSNASFFSVETIIATATSTTTSHAPAATEGFYRVIRRQ